MDDLAVIKFDLVPSQPLKPLGMTILIDDQEVWSCASLDKHQRLEFKINDSVEQSHSLVWQLWGKTVEHTVLNDQGDIISDSLIAIENVSLDDIDINNLLPTICLYKHDFNGTGQTVDDKFFGAMGCNGTVTMRFATPLYLWLLETM